MMNTPPDSYFQPQVVDPTVLTAELEEYLEGLTGSSHDVYDPIRARRERAAANLSHFGLLSFAQFSEVDIELSQRVSFDPQYVRVERMALESADGSVRETTRVTTAGYKELDDGTYDAVVWSVEMPDGRANGWSDELRRKLASFCPNLDRPTFVRAGTLLQKDADLHELLVAEGRDNGFAVRDKNRIAGEDPVPADSVRKHEPPQQRISFSQAA